MSVLVDTSVWIDYFNDTGRADALDLLIEEDLVVINDLILAELVPPLHLRGEKKLITLLRHIKRRPLATDWDDIVGMQIICLGNGINGVGVPDLIIAQNAIRGNLRLLSNDKHFSLISRFIPLDMYR